MPRMGLEPTAFTMRDKHEGVVKAVACLSLSLPVHVSFTEYCNPIE